MDTTKTFENTDYLCESYLSKKEIDLSIIIINYNLAKEIENCLNSLFCIIDSLGQIEYEVIIVDNNSPDKDLPGIQENFNRSNIKFYYLNENLGFGKGCNFGFSKSSGKYICFLNPDTIIQEDIFKPIIKLFESDHFVGIVGPKQQMKSRVFDASAGFYPNIFFELFNLIGLGVFFECFIVFLYTKIKGNKQLNVDWVLGAALFIRAELFRKIDGFDKDYFMFSEEVDLCKRVSDRGYRIIYCPELKIHHIGNITGKRDYSLYTIRTYASKYIYISKHYKPFQKYMMKFLLFVQIYSQILIWIVLFPRNKEKSKQKIKGFIYLIKNKMKL